MHPAPHSPHAACFENHFDVVQSWFFLNSMLFGFLGAWFSDLFFPCSEAYRMESKGKLVSTWSQSWGRNAEITKSWKSRCLVKRVCEANVFFPKNLAAGQHFCGTFLFRYMWFIWWNMTMIWGSANLILHEVFFTSRDPKRSRWWGESKSQTGEVELVGGGGRFTAWDEFLP